MQIFMDRNSLYLEQIPSAEEGPLNDIEMTNSRENEGNLCPGCGAPVRGDESHTFCDNCR